jgi:preprotein translocase subunit SecE
MATEVVATETKSLPARLVTFYHDVTAEMKKVTWPERPQVQQLTLLTIALSLFVGALIWVLDLGLQFVLVTVPQMLFGT